MESFSPEQRLLVKYKRIQIGNAAIFLNRHWNKIEI